MSNELHPGRANVVVIVSGDDAHLVDALVAAPLARARDASLLLVGPEVPAELDRLGVTDAIFVGGADAVSQHVIDALKQRGIASTRIAGADRYDTAVGLRDRALIGVMVYTFARVGALLQMKVGDYFIRRRRG